MSISESCARFQQPGVTTCHSATWYRTTALGIMVVRKEKIHSWVVSAFLSDYSTIFTYILLHIKEQVLEGRSEVTIPVSRILHHSHPYFIYEVLMKYIWEEYDVVMKWISIFFSNNEVVNTAMFVYYQNIIKLLLLIFN